MDFKLGFRQKADIVLAELKTNTYPVSLTLCLQGCPPLPLSYSKPPCLPNGEERLGSISAAPSGPAFLPEKRLFMGKSAFLF